MFYAVKNAINRLVNRVFIRHIKLFKNYVLIP